MTEDLYDTDLLQWCEKQAALLRRRAAGEPISETELDWPNVAEEFEALGRSKRSSIAGRIATVIEHLARLETCRTIEPRIGWQETILRARTGIDTILESSPSLRPTLDAVVAREHGRALRLVANTLALYGETSRGALEGIRYSTEQVIGP